MLRESAKGIGLADIDKAVADGLVSERVAEELRRRASAGYPDTEIEAFGPVTSLADLLCAVGLIVTAAPLYLWLVDWSPFLTVGLVPAYWLLAEAVRNRAAFGVTRLLLFVALIIQCALGALAIGLMLPGVPTAMATDGRGTPADAPPLMGLLVAGGCAAACLAWWRRFGTPIAFPAACIALLNAAIHIARMLVPNMPATGVAYTLLGGGLVLLGVAIWWDMTDVRRRTWRTDVAFWLHLAGGYQLAAATYRLLFGVVGEPSGWARLYVFETQAPSPAQAALGCAVFFLFAIVAVALNRRSLILASLLFLLPALMRLPEPPLFSISLIGAFLVGSALTWGELRVRIVAMLPVIVQAQLARTSANARPASDNVFRNRSGNPC